MAFPCCMSLSVGVRLAALLSILLALGLGAASGWLLKETYEYRNSNAVSSWNTVQNSANNVFGSTVIDTDKVSRIKLACSGAAFGAAVLQLFTSLLLLCCSSAKGGRSTAKLYIFINIFVMLAVAGVIGCFLSAEGVDYKGNSNDARLVQYQMGACGIDFILLIYLLAVAGAFIRS